MKRILSLVLVLALVAAMGLFTTASAADEGFVDGKRCVSAEFSFVVKPAEEAEA